MSAMLPYWVIAAAVRARDCADRVGAGIAILLGHLEPPKRPLWVAAGGAPLTPRVAVFCHFEPRGRLIEHVRRYITALSEAGLSLVFVTNSGRLDPEAVEWLRPRCAWIVVRRNSGFDFAAWRDGLAVAQLPAADTELLLIANDSVYGPLRPLQPLLTRLDFTAADVWGLTDSWQSRFHLQSYWVAFGPRAMRHPAFRRFWARVHDLRSKKAVIHKYEIGMTRALLDGGLTCEALWPYVDTLAPLHGASAAASEAGPLQDVRLQAEQRILALAARRVPLNPTAELWRLLLTAGFPFLKRELLRKNPAAVPDVACWLELTQAVSPEEAGVILRDLRLTLRKTAP